MIGEESVSAGRMATRPLLWLRPEFDLVHLDGSQCVKYISVLVVLVASGVVGCSEAIEPFDSQLVVRATVDTFPVSPLLIGATGTAGAIPLVDGRAIDDSTVQVRSIASGTCIPRPSATATARQVGSVLQVNVRLAFDLNPRLQRCELPLDFPYQVSVTRLSTRPLKVRLIQAEVRLISGGRDTTVDVR
jgi:hypothetical protein